MAKRKGRRRGPAGIVREVFMKRSALPVAGERGLPVEEPPRSMSGRM